VVAAVAGESATASATKTAPATSTDERIRRVLAQARGARGDMGDSGRSVARVVVSMVGPFRKLRWRVA
jgi:hypothetical protein